MNSQIDLKNFGSGTIASGAEKSRKLVGPPRRILSRYVLPMALLAGFAGIGAYSFKASFIKPTEVMVTLPVPAGDKIGEALAQQADKIETARRSLFQAPGWIEPEPYSIILSSLRPGTVESINVIEGDTVSSGALVARLVDEDAHLAVQTAKSALALKQAKYKSATANWSNPTSLREAVETAKANGEKLKAEAAGLGDMMRLAVIEARIGHTLSKGGYEASLETKKKETELSASRSKLEETHALIRLNSATLSAANERLSLRIEDKEAVEAARAEVLSAKADLATAKLQLSRSEIRTHTSGTIMRLTASPGSLLSSEAKIGFSIATMYQPEKLQVRVDVPLGEAAKVRPGLEAEIQVEALPDRKFTGELVNIVPEFDLQKNVLPVKVRIHDPAQALRPEMIARVEFFDGGNEKHVAKNSTDISTTKTVANYDPDNIFLLPEKVVSREGDSAFILVAGPDGHVHRRKIVSSPASDGMLAVTEGIRASDKIIVEPKTLQVGSLIHIQGIIENVTD